MQRFKLILRWLSSVSGLLLSFAFVLFVSRELGNILSVLLAVYAAPGGALFGCLAGEFVLFVFAKGSGSVWES